MLDKSKLGNRYTCYECGTKFYDLNRPAPICPDCNADQTNAPVQDIRSLLNRNTAGNRPKEEVEPKSEDTSNEAGEAADSEFDDDDADMDLGLDELDDAGDDDAGLLIPDVDDDSSAP